MRGGRVLYSLFQRWSDTVPTNYHKLTQHLQRGVPGVSMLLILASSVDWPEIFGSQFPLIPRLFVRVKVGTLDRLAVCIFGSEVLSLSLRLLVVLWPL